MTFSEGYLTAVAQVTNSTVPVDFVIELGKRKAGKFSSRNINTKGTPPLIPYPLLTEFDKGWIEGMHDTFDAFKKGEITIDTESDTFIPLKVLENLIQHGYNEADTKNKEERKKYIEMQEYRKKQEEREKENDYHKYPYPKQYPPIPDKYKKYNKQESHAEIIKRKEEASRRKKDFNSYCEPKTNTPDRP